MEKKPLGLHLSPSLLLARSSSASPSSFSYEAGRPTRPPWPRTHPRPPPPPSFPSFSLSDAWDPAVSAVIYLVTTTRIPRHRALASATPPWPRPRSSPRRLDKIASLLTRLPSPTALPLSLSLSLSSAPLTTIAMHGYSHARIHEHTVAIRLSNLNARARR
jgi:hypothetical protein